MARLQTDDSDTGTGTPSPRGDERLDDWFARRLEAQGIGRAQRRPLATARVLSVLGLVLAMGALVWALTLGGGSSPPATTTGSNPGSTVGSTTATIPTTPAKTKVPAWKRIKLTVLNGYGGTGAAGRVAAQLAQQGFKVVAHGSGGTSTTATYVAYAPGFQVGAGVIARKLGLPAPVPLAQAPGVTATPKTGVVLVLGSNLLG
ncbi:MAG TPA: LytR C-terminal domain-containing protein [Gaiellales bacterium]|nr:LytR C-terminal domain-containing protein [Gaiellales bacterium]